MKTPYLTQKQLSDFTQEVISGYQKIVGESVKPPIKVEDIIERYLKLDIDYKNFAKEHGLRNVFGATYMQKRLIAVSEDLLNDKNEGRLCFTFAHEMGHWVLHRKLVGIAERTASGMEAVFCRSKDAKTLIEWQADYFAGCLLMPGDDVRNAFYGEFGISILDLHNVKKSFPSTPFHFDTCVENWHRIACAVCEKGNFSNVSKQAMIIRLQQLGLVKNHTKEKMAWRRPVYLTQ